MNQCPHCSSTESQTKAGRTRTGSQRDKCRECQRVYTPEPKPLGYPAATKREAVRLYLEGTNLRRIGRVLAVNHQSVINLGQLLSRGTASRRAERRAAGGS